MGEAKPLTEEELAGIRNCKPIDGAIYWGCERLVATIDALRAELAEMTERAERAEQGWFESRDECKWLEAAVEDSLEQDERIKAAESALAEERAKRERAEAYIGVQKKALAQFEGDWLRYRNEKQTAEVARLTAELEKAESEGAVLRKCLETVRRHHALEPSHVCPAAMGDTHAALDSTASGAAMLERMRCLEEVANGVRVFLGSSGMAGKQLTAAALAKLGALGAKGGG